MGLIFNDLKHYRYIYKQIKFISQPKEKHLLERQFIIVVQYFLPHVSYSVINTWIDSIAQEVLSRLKNKFPAHSIFLTSLKQFSFWRENNINDNYWNEQELKQIMHIIEEFIYTDLNLYNLYELLAIPDSAAEYINYVSYFRLY